MRESHYLYDQEDRLAKFEKIPFLKSFKQPFLRHVLNASKFREYPPGETIIREGMKDRWLYILLFGKVRVVKEGEVIAIIDQVGDIFGELAIISRKERSATVTAETKTYCLAVDATFLDKLNPEDQQAFYAVIYRMCVEILSNRLQITSEELALARQELHRLRKIDASMPVEQKIEMIKNQCDELLALPQVTAQVIALCDKPEVNAEQLTSLIELDPALSASVMRHANSVLHGGVETIDSLQDAVVRLGHRTIRALATMTSVFHMSSTHTRTFVFDRFLHWVHLLGTGVIAEELAIRCKYAKPEDAFLAGVLHDFGKLFLDDYLHDEYQRVNTFYEERHITISEAEQDVLGVTHESIGEHISRRWKLPEDICTAIGKHHDVSLLNPKDHRQVDLSQIVYLANLISMAMQIGRSNNLCNTYIPAEWWDAVVMPPDQLPAFVEKVMHRVSELIKLLKIPARNIPAIMRSQKEAREVVIEDGGNVDRLLDIFFIMAGFIPNHVLGAQRIAEVPAYTIYDVRAATSFQPKSDPPDAQPEVKYILLKQPTSPVLEHISVRAQVFESPLDYQKLMREIQ